MSDNWCTIESDPDVFTALVEAFGVKGVQVVELYSLDDLVDIGEVHGLIFLFKWTGEKNPRPSLDFVPELFFAKQVITNACATQAILSVLLNAKDRIDLGPTLTEFLSFTSDFPSDLKGEAISNSETIRTTHNSFSRQDPFIHEASEGGKEKEAFHFIAYVPKGGKVYELDGLQKGPVELGVGDDWLSIAAPAIQERMASGCVKFNLLAITRSRSDVASERRAAAAAELESLQASTSEIDGSVEARLVSTIAECDAVLAQEAASRERGVAENQRRKHNYIPFCVRLLEALAHSGHLEDMITKGREKVEAAAKNKSDAKA